MYSPRTGPNLNASAEPPPSSQTLSKSGVTIDDEVLVDAHLVVAGAGLVERGPHQVREVPVEDLARARVRFGRNPAVARIGILRRTAADPHAEAAVVGWQRRPSRAAGHPEARHVRMRKTRVGGRDGEVEHVSHGDAQAASHQLREHLGEPGAAGEDDGGCGEGIAAVERHRFQRRAAPAAEVMRGRCGRPRLPLRRHALPTRSHGAHGLRRPPARAGRYLACRSGSTASGRPPRPASTPRRARPGRPSGSAWLRCRVRPARGE